MLSNTNFSPWVQQFQSKIRNRNRNVLSKVECGSKNRVFVISANRFSIRISTSTYKLAALYYDHG